VLTIAFTLFSSMVALKAAYDQAINVNRMDRLLVNPRFCCTGFSITLRDEITRMPGVRGAALIQGVFGFQREPSRRVGIWTIDRGTVAAIPDLRLTPEQWKQIEAKPTGLFFTRTQAAKWNVKAGDPFPVQSPGGGRADGAPAWPFEVLGVVDDPEPKVDWMPNIYGNYDYFDSARQADQRGRVSFIFTIDDPDEAEHTCQVIDTRYANSETPTWCVPLQVDARSMVESTISMRQMSFAIAAAGLFMILFLCANSIGESVRERLPEFAVLKTIGFGDRQIAALVFLEAALACSDGSVLGTALGTALGTLTSKLGEGSGLNLLPSYPSIGIVALALGAALLIGAASVVLPLRRLKALDIAPALAGR